MGSTKWAVLVLAEKWGQNGKLVWASWAGRLGSNQTANVSECTPKNS